MKLGDKVKIRDGCLPFSKHLNEIGTITTVNYLTAEFMVKWPKVGSQAYLQRYIELADESILTDKEIAEFEDILEGLMGCTCETRFMTNFGCHCEAGKAELDRERAK